MEQKKHILIADIDGDLLTRLAIFFEDKGYDTTTAWGGVKRWNNFTPDNSRLFY